MKTIATLFLVFTIVISTRAQSAPAQANLSPAEQNIAKARKLIEQNPKNFEAYNALALALSRRARETSDVAYYAQAEEALQKSFAISPENFDGARVHAWLLLGKHEFAGALEESTKLNKKMPDDITVYGFLTDANVELGNYNAAEAAAQRMLDLRPGTLAALTRAAYLRELFGDVEGALQLMNMAFQSTPPSEVEDGAWILTQMAHLKLSVGKTGEAETLLTRALTMFPNYHYALANLAKVRLQQKRYAEAVTLLGKRYQAAAHAENLYDLAEALQLSGRTQEAGKAFAEFEKKSLVETTRADNSNHELIFYYADHANQPEKALQVAGREIARRHDIYTLDSYAWALFVNGQYAAARKQMEAALAPGVRDAKLFRHAGEIALKNGDRAAAESYLRQAVELNAPGSDQASKTLSALGSTLAKR